MRRSIPSNFASSPESRSEAAIGITWRGFWTGIFLSFFLAIGAPYANMAMHSTFMAWDFNTPGAILVDDGEDNRAFFEGGEIPYGAWAEPLLWWWVFLIALYATMVAAAVVLRRQWMDRERLAYPVAQVGAAMVQGEGRGLVNRFFKSRAMWYGCAIPVLWGSLEALHQYYPSLPNVNLNWSMPYFGQRLQLRVIFAMVGFSYLINTSISAGLWIFQLLVRAESEVLLLMGLTSKQKFVYGIASQPYLAYQGGGALLALVLAGLWVGREHLKRVFRKALWGARDIDDGDEIVPYRGAVCALLAGVATMVGWLTDLLFAPLAARSCSC